MQSEGGSLSVAVIGLQSEGYSQTFAVIELQSDGCKQRVLVITGHRVAVIIDRVAVM